MGRYGLTGKYAYKNNEDDWTYFNGISGVRVLSLTGIDERGDAVNVYNAQWVDSEQEDFIIAHEEEKIIRKNVDVQLTMIIGRRYTVGESINEQATYDAMITTLCESGDIYLWSGYLNKKVHVVCVKSFKPTTVHLHRGRDSYILVTIPFHVLEPPQSSTDPVVSS